jgi:protein-ribulosamine 3-kinase
VAVHPLLAESVVRQVARSATAHRGRPWVETGFTDLNDRASHPCGVFHGEPFSVFAKLDTSTGDSEQFTAELRGLDLVRRLAGVATPTPVATGIVTVDGGSLLMYEALPERPTGARTAQDWRAIGRTLAALHSAHDGRFGLAAGDGFFGPLRQDNRPISTDRWADFYAERRVLPLLRSAVDAGTLPADIAAGVERLVPRLPDLCGPEPRPSLLHGDAQQNNFISIAAGAVVIDAVVYFGHPEVDLALVDLFTPVPDAVFDGYREMRPIDPGFPRRRELWRLHGYLAVVTVDGANPFGRQYVGRIAAAARSY